MAKEAAPRKTAKWSRKTLPRLILVLGAESALRNEALAAIKAAGFGDEDPGMSWVVYHGPANQSEGALTPSSLSGSVPLLTFSAFLTG